MDFKVQGTIDKASYVPGEVLRLNLNWKHPSIEISQVGNMSTDIFRLGVKRNNFTLGWGKSPIIMNNDLILETTLPNSMRAGVHVISGTMLTEVNGEELTKPLAVRFEPVYFEVREHFRRPATGGRLADRIRELSEGREKFINATHKTSKATGDSAKDIFFVVTVFGVGCLFHSRQQLEGYRIDPLGAGLSHRRPLELVNSFLESEMYDGLPYVEETETRFEQSTPAIAVTFPRVQAVDHEDALNYCREFCRKLFQVLGMERGQIPREFAYLAMEHNTTNRWHGFEMPGYRGNLVSDFNPAQLANQIEQRLPKLEASRFTQLLVRSYAEATGERDFGFRVLRYWTVLELAADRIIQKGQRLENPDGTEILKPNGQPETTNSKHGRVYQYILQSGAFASMSTHHIGDGKVSIILGDESDKRFKPGMIVVRLWEMIQAIYAIRCAVAHEGYFDPTSRGSVGETLASDFLTRGFPDPLDFVKMQALMAIWREG